MADAIARVSVVPDGVDQDIETINAALIAQAGIDDTVTVDRGLDLVVSSDIVHSAAGDVDGSVASANIETAIANVGNLVKVGDIKIERDPVLSSPADVTLDISDATVVVRTYDVTLSEDVSLASAAITTNEVPSAAAVISRGNPQGHESQKTSDGTINVRFGPAIAGDEVGSPHNVIITVTDSNGRTATDTIVVTVQA